MNTSKDLKNKMTREEYIKKAHEVGMTEKENDIVLPYEILPIGITIVEKFELE